MYSSGRLSPSAFESSERKDLAISRLKAEAGELTRTQSDFLKLSTELSQLERKFKQLNEEKVKNETIFTSKHELNQQTITELRSELAQIKLHIRDKNAELEMIKSQKEIKNRENMSFQERFATLGFQLNEERDQEAALNSEIRRMQNELSAIDGEKNFRKSRKLELRREAETVTEKIHELEGFFNELEYERTRLGKLINQQETENSNISLEIESRDQKLRYFVQKIAEADETQIRLMQSLEDKSAYKERLLLDIKMSEKTQKNESLRGEELKAKLARLEQSHSKKKEDIDNVKSKVIDEEKKADNVRALIEQLMKDREALKKRLENLHGTRQRVFSEIQKIDQENEQINYLLSSALVSVKQGRRPEYSTAGGTEIGGRIYKSNEKLGSLKNSNFYSGDH